jgi:hypothetical protein
VQFLLANQVAEYRPRSAQLISVFDIGEAPSFSLQGNAFCKANKTGAAAGISPMFDGCDVKMWFTASRIWSLVALPGQDGAVAGFSESAIP